MHKMRRILVFGALVMMMLVTNSPSNAQSRVHIVAGSGNNQMRVLDTYPEYWVDGKPFFQYAGAFLYYRLPRDRWAEEMLALKAMGLNTLDVIPMWNWHEPEEGQTDYDGHTNPRRDLKYVFALANSLGLKITLRPGPYDTNEWRNGGYPDWLLRRPEYRMSQQEILEGRYPRWSALQYEHSEEAATEWLKNDTHLKYTRQYFQNVLGVATPFFADHGGPILSVQMDDDQGNFAENYNGPNFWKYMDTLRKFAKQATDGRPLIYFIDGALMRVNAEANDALQEPFWNQGQDYSSTSPSGYSTPAGASQDKFLLEIVKTQPLFIPSHIEFQAGSWPTGDDTFTRQVDATDTLMASRVMFQNGLKGLSYFPPDDTINPAGYSVSWSNHFYVWEAALNFMGKETGRAVYVRRNGRLVTGMGPLLASSHLLADAGVVYPMATFPQEPLTAAEARRAETLALRVLWAGAYDHRSFELVDSDHTPLENFQRYRVLFAPNLVNGKKDKKRFPHLERYSEKAQQLLADYVNSGGTLILFPSLPEGKIFDSLLVPLGSGRLETGEGPLKFSDGTTARGLDFHSVLTLPKNARAEVKIFARDAHGGIVGARVAHGKGQIIFFGADFSTWIVPAGTEFTSEGGLKPGPRDYSEETQQAARLALPALLKEGGAVPKVYPEMKTEKARDLGLYVTELVADAGSLPFEKRVDANGYGFVGVTNFSVEEGRTAEIVLTDPRTTDLAAAPKGTLRLPALTLPPRESLLLPVRVPLLNPYWENAPGLDPADEVYYATAELSHVAYDGQTLKLELTAPTEGEVALRLARRPERATLDGQSTAIQEDPERHLYVVKIARAAPPHFLRSLDLAYPHEGPHLTIEPREPWITGETRAVRVRVENPGPAPFAGELDLVAGSLYGAENPPLEVRIPAQASREFSFPVEIPDSTTPNQPIELTSTLRERGSPTTWAWRSEVTVHRPFDFSVGPTLTFPLREDLPVPIVHPTLASLVLPGEAAFQVRVKNWQDHELAVTVAAGGSNLTLTPALTQLILPAASETTVAIHAVPKGGSGLYRFAIDLRSGDYKVSEGVVVAACAKGEAIAYQLDYDRDGFPDVILENSAVRLFLSPYDGGRAFAFVSKTTGANAFNSVGGMCDNFSKRREPEDARSLPGWAQSDWLGLFDRPYAFRIVTATGASVAVHLEYSAPDIYPKGVKLERALTLPGDGNYYLTETSLTPAGVADPQSYILENSVTFKVFNQPENFRQWFAEGHAPEEFVPDRTVNLPSGSSFAGAINKQTGETFAILSLSPLAQTQLAAHPHAATVRMVYPPFTEKNQTYTFRAAYFFGKATNEEIQALYARLKGKKK
jgi:hypothetical protein